MERQNTDSKSPLLMPGPQFNQEGDENGWFQRNSQKLILGVIIILLGIGAFSFYKNYSDRRAMIESALNGIESPAASQEIAAPSASPEEKISIVGPESPKPQATAQEKSDKISSAPASNSPEAKKENGSIIVKAAKGNGATHLARQALKEYLKDKDFKDSIKAEQKIYIEDYLQKKAGSPKVMEVGQEISFSSDLIQEAIDHAQNLSSGELQNLQKYIPLVPSI